MVSDFDSMFAGAGVPALMETLGTAEIVYSDPEQDPVTLTAILGNMEVVEREDGASQGRRKRYVRNVTVSTDPDGDYGGVAAPKLTATLEIDGDTWAVESIESQGGSLVKLGCVRKTVSEQARGGYRGR